MLKRFLILSMILGSVVFGASVSIEARTSTSVNGSADPQWQSTRYENRRNRRGARVYTRTRIVRRNGRLYREVWQYRSLPNGRVTTRLLSRTRIYRSY